jgi:AraC-like DNA-binding protein
MDILESQGIHAAQIARPDARVACGAALAALRDYVDATGDAAIGLRAGQAVEPGDLDVMEYAARCCNTLREAIACSARYVHLAIDDALIELQEDGRDGLCAFRGAGRGTHPAADAFVVTAATTLVRRYTSAGVVALEAHVRGRTPPNADEYPRALGCSVRFGMPDDAILLARSHLESRMTQACPKVQQAFESYAGELGQEPRAGYRRLTHDIATAELRSGRLTMASAAGTLGVSAATLRRRLREERTTFREVVDQVRCALAESYLLDHSRSITEIASLLGFSYVAAFNKAFRRWKGVSPSQHRSRAACVAS